MALVQARLIRKVLGTVLSGASLGAAGCSDHDRLAEQSPNSFQAVGQVVRKQLDTTGADRLMATRIVHLGADPELVAIRTAASRDGRIVYFTNYAPTDCAVRAVDLLTGTILWRVGVCGDGPNEFRAISVLQVVQGGVVAWDAQARRLTRISENGEILSQIDASDSWLSAGRPIRALGLSGTGEIDLVVSDAIQFPGKPDTASLVLRAPGAVARQARLSHPLVFQHTRAAFEFGYPSCVRDDAHEALVLNRWLAEIALVGETITLFSLDIPWVGRGPLPSRPGRPLQPATVGEGVACGLRTAAIGYVLADSGGNLLKSFVGLIDPVAGRLLSLAEGGPSDSVLFGTPVFASESTVVLRNNHSRWSPAFIVLARSSLPLNEESTHASVVEAGGVPDPARQCGHGVFHQARLGGRRGAALRCQRSEWAVLPLRFPDHPTAMRRDSGRWQDGVYVDDVSGAVDLSGHDSRLDAMQPCAASQQPCATPWEPGEAGRES